MKTADKVKSTKDYSPIIQITAITVSLLSALSMTLWLNEIAEDAYISFRYAENFASGSGLVYNIGEKVEGYTNFLWVMILAAISYLSFDVPTYGQITSIFFFGLILFTFQQLCRHFRLGIWLAAIMTISLALNPCLARWASSGMEVTLYSSLLLLTLFFYFTSGEKSPDWLWGLFLGLSCVTRPEAIAIAGLFFLFAFFSKGKPLFKRFIMPLIIVMALVGSHVLFRLLYYQALFPNTYLAKVHGVEGLYGRGLSYVHSFLIFHDYYFFAIIPLFLLSSLRRKVEFLLPLSLSILAVIIVIFEGGDFYDYYRFLTPYLPFFYLLLALTWSYLFELSSREWFKGTYVFQMFLISVIVLFSLDMSFHAFPWRAREAHNFLTACELNHSRRLVGMSLKQNCPPETTIMINCAGIIPYYSRLPSIDAMGITNAEIARSLPPEGVELMSGHDKFNPQAILALKPDLVLPMNGELLEQRTIKEFRSLDASKVVQTVSDEELIIRFNYVFPLYVADKFLMSQQEFLQNYRPLEMSVNSSTFILFARSDFEFPEYLIKEVKDFALSGRKATFYSASQLMYSGNYCFGKGQFEQSIDFFNGSLVMYPYRRIVYNQLGAAYSRIKDYTNAAKSFKLAMTYFPDDDSIRKNYESIRSLGAE